MSTPWIEEGRKMRIAVLCSGTGTNFQAILESVSQGRLEADIVVLGVDLPIAGAVAIARRSRIAIVHRAQVGSKKKRDAEFAEQIEAYHPDLIVLAGYMRILPKLFLSRFRTDDASVHSRIVNIHPSLLPLYPGLDAVTQALDDNTNRTGATVHIVDEGIDTGPILGQKIVSVCPDDTPKLLTQRIKEVEHVLLPEVLGRIAEYGIAKALEIHRISS